MLRSILTVLVVALIISACGEQPAPTQGELKTMEVACDKANEGKRIAVEGYLMLPDKVSGDFSVMLRLLDSPERVAQANVAASVRIDKERKAPNTMDNLSTSYSDADLKVRTADGQTIGYQDKVRVSGKMYFPSSTASVEFTCGLENPLIEKTE